MRSTRPLLRFACLFALIYGILIVPWPGWNTLYGGYFRAFNGLVLSTEGPVRIVRFKPSPPGSVLDTEIVVASADAVAAEGKLKALRLGLDSRGVGWIPTALLLSLVLSTPVAWTRRMWSVVLGTFSVHIFIVLTCAVDIWDKTLVPLGLDASDFMKFKVWVADGLEETLVIQLGASFVVPAIVWLFVTFNRNDLEAIQRLLGAGGKALASPAGGKKV
jgi:hypothetical protein